MSSAATINLGGGNPQQNSTQVYPAGGQGGQVFHVQGNNPNAEIFEEPVTRISIQKPKFAYSAANYPSGPQQQQQQEQQMQEIYYQPQQQYQIQQQYQPPPQHHQQQYQQPQYHQQPQYQQAPYQPQEQFHQQYAAPQQAHHQAIQIGKPQPHPNIHASEGAKPPVFEAPLDKIQIIRRNQSAPMKTPPAVTMQQSFRSSRSGSLAGLDEITDPPHFVKHPESNQTVNEGEAVTLTARVTPAGDPNLTIQWYKDGEPLATGSRYNTSFERGFAVLFILYSYKEDEGEYSCVAKNKFGMDQTSPSGLKVIAEENVIVNSHLPQEMSASIAAIEASLHMQKVSVDYAEAPTRPPQFVKGMPGLYNLKEGQSLHLEARVIPVNDSSLIIEWHKNGKPLDNGCRFNTISDRGFAILDIVGVIPEDSGDYFCLAKNMSGQAHSNTTRLTVAADETVVTSSALPKESVQYLQSLDAQALDETIKSDFRYIEEQETDSPPHFDIKPTDLCISEGSPVKILVKVSGFPRPRIQWIMNNGILSSTTTQKVYHDGAISYLEIQRCKDVGENHVTVLAKNKFGEATVNIVLTVIPENDFRPDLKRVDPENPFKKLTTLRKVEVMPELKNAFRKQKPMAIELDRVEKDALLRGKFNKSKEASDAETLYTNVQSRLKRSDRLSYAGAPNNVGVPSNNYDVTNSVTLHQAQEQQAQQYQAQQYHDQTPQAQVIHQQMPQNIGYHQVSQNVGYQQMPQNVGYQQMPQNVGYQQMPQNVSYQQVPQNVTYQQVPQQMQSSQISLQLGPNVETHASQAQFTFSVTK